MAKGQDFFWHLEVLRFKIIRTLAFLAVAFGIAFFFVDKIALFLQAPLSGFHVELNYFKPYEKFTTYTKIAFFTSLFFTAIYAFFELAGFVYPALKKNEKKFFFGGLAIVPLLFGAGTYFSYKFILPLAFKFFISFAATDGVRPVWGLQAYYDFILGLTFVTGTLFLLPVPFVFLIKAGIIDTAAIKTLRPYIIVGIVTAAAVLTPDVVSLFLVAIPLYILFEISVWISQIKLS